MCVSGPEPDTLAPPLKLRENTMWYKITWSNDNYREEKYTELIFSYEDKLELALATKVGVLTSELVIHEIEKYEIKEGIA